MRGESLKNCDSVMLSKIKRIIFMYNLVVCKHSPKLLQPFFSVRIKEVGNIRIMH